MMMQEETSCQLPPTRSPMITVGDPRTQTQKSLITTIDALLCRLRHRRIPKPAHTTAPPLLNRQPCLSPLKEPIVVTATFVLTPTPLCINSPSPCFPLSIRRCRACLLNSSVPP
ncbi:hypothetical protein M0R45_019619 [Rubus argutus]|uniref:Uncharacterized protein n=1 Tax=Rubus argutus TaxID=59490 RepID=A0AAW1X7H0_RUBAR